jgi:hypothetical protein
MNSQCGYENSFGSNNGNSMYSYYSASSLSGNVIQVVYGEYHIAILCDTGKAYAIGYNGYGQFGTGDITSTNTFVELKFTPKNGGTKIMRIASGHRHIVIMDDKYAVYASGRNDLGQLGIGQSATNNKIFYFIGWYTHIACGGNHTLFYNSGEYSGSSSHLGSLYVCGYNSEGQLGLNNTTTYYTPTKINYLVLPVYFGYITKISAGYNFSYFLDSSGYAYSAGCNLNKQLGRNTESSAYSYSTVFKGVSVGYTFTNISCGHDHVLFHDNTTYKVYGCGSNTYGQLTQLVSSAGTQTITNIFSNTKHILSGKWQSFFGDMYNGTVYACGDDSHRQLGLGNTYYRNKSSSYTYTSMPQLVKKNNDVNFTTSCLTTVYNTLSVIYSNISISSNTSYNASSNLTSINNTSSDLYYTSSNSEIPINSSTGSLTTTNSGSTTITISQKENDYYTATSASYNVVIVEDSSSSTPVVHTNTITITNPSSSQSYLYTTNNSYCTATSSYTNPTDPNTALKYYSSNNSVATISETSGLITYINVGTARITVTQNAGQDINGNSYTSASASVDLNIVKSDIGLHVNDTEFKIIADASYQFYYDTNEPYDGNITYYSSNTNIAEINSNGIVSLNNTGNVNLTINLSGSTKYYDASGTTFLTIESEKYPSNLTAPIDASINIYETSYNYAENITSDSNGAYYYSSSNTNLATVDTSGMVYRTSSTVGGECVLTVNQYEYSNYDSGSANTSLKIYAATVLSAPATLTVYFTNLIYPFYKWVNTNNSSGKITYYSSNPSVATIDVNSGIIYMYTTGSTTITVYQDASKYYTTDASSSTLLTFEPIHGWIPKPVIEPLDKSSSQYSTVRHTLRNAWNTSYPALLKENNINKPILTPFRVITNTGDLLSRADYSNTTSCQSHQSRPNMFGLGTRFGSSHISSHPSYVGNYLQENTTIPSATCNPKYVYMGADYVKYLKEKAINKNYNDVTNGGDKSKAAQSALKRVRR